MQQFSFQGAIILNEVLSRCYYFYKRKARNIQKPNKITDKTCRIEKKSETQETSTFFSGTVVLPSLPSFTWFWRSRRSGRRRLKRRGGGWANAGGRPTPHDPADRFRIRGARVRRPAAAASRRRPRGRSRAFGRPSTGSESKSKRWPHNASLNVSPTFDASIENRRRTEDEWRAGRRRGGCAGPDTRRRWRRDARRRPIAAPAGRPRTSASPRPASPPATATRASRGDVDSGRNRCTSTFRSAAPEWTENNPVKTSYLFSKLINL